VSEQQNPVERFVGRLSRESDGRPLNLVWFGGVALMGLLFVYGLVVHGTVVGIGPALAVLFALNGVAESLPAERRRVAFGTRLLALAYTAVLIAVTLTGQLV
jgi:hypothetical protein